MRRGRAKPPTMGILNKESRADLTPIFPHSFHSRRQRFGVRRARTDLCTRAALATRSHYLKLGLSIHGARVLTSTVAISADCLL